MAQIIINIADEADAPNACREVAVLIEGGYYNGFIGVSNDTFEFNK